MDRTGRLARSFFPQVSATAGQEKFKTGSDATQEQEYWNLEAAINLYKGGRDQLEDKIRDSNLSLAQTLLSSEHQNELKEARLAYWNVVALTQQIANRNDAMRKNKLNFKSAKRRAGAGLTTTADAAQFELHRISIERELSKLELERDLSLNQLGVTLALDEHENIEVASFRKKGAHAIREGKALGHELRHDLSVLGNLIKTADQDVQAAVEKYFEFRDKRIEYHRDFFSTKAVTESLIFGAIVN